MSNSQRMFIRIPKGSNDLKDARVFKGRGNLILHLLQNKTWLDKYFETYDILEITCISTKQPIEDFKELIENWEPYGNNEKDENPKIIREDNFTKKEILLKELFNTKNKDYLHKQINHQNWP